MSPIRRTAPRAAGPAEPPAVFAGTRTSSAMVFHSPQEGHFPYHLGDSQPHAEQTKTVFAFAAIFNHPFPGEKAGIPLSHILRIGCIGAYARGPYCITPPAMAKAICAW